MKISDMKFNCRCDALVEGVHSGDFTFIFFRNPAVFRSGGREKTVKAASAAVYRNNSQVFFRPFGKDGLIYDMISFRPTPAEFQSISDMGIPFDSPIELSESVIIRTLLKSISEFAHSYGSEKKSFLENALNLIFAGIAEQLSENNIGKKAEIPHYAKLNKLRERIYANPSNRWNIDEICSELAVSRTYFHRIYFAAFGATCMQDVIDSRISYASEMLADSDLSVSSIAENCGYDSDSYFMRQFKKNTGFTPTEYRRRFSR